MPKKQEKQGIDNASPRAPAANLPADPALARLKASWNSLKAKHEVSDAELFHALSKEILIPLTIFSKVLSPLETIVKYLKENCNLNIQDIAKLLNRNSKTIWQRYHAAHEKNKEQLKPQPTAYYIPASMLGLRNMSILETIVFSLRKDQQMSYHEIAALLQRDDRTIWTVAKRAERKNG